MRILSLIPIITGQITNLDEDRIEITSTNEEVIYIDFGYEGIPVDLQIEKIIIRDTPITSKKLTPQDISEGDEDSTEDSPKEFSSKDESNEPQEPQDDIYSDDAIKDVEIEEKLNKIEDINKQIFEADQISFGEDLEEIVQIINIPESKKLYNIDKQTNDMLNEFLSTIANINRTEEVVNNIHLIIDKNSNLKWKHSHDFKNN